MGGRDPAQPGGAAGAGARTPHTSLASSHFPRTGALPPLISVVAGCTVAFLCCSQRIKTNEHSPCPSGLRAGAVPGAGLRCVRGTWLLQLGWAGAQVTFGGKLELPVYFSARKCKLNWELLCLQPQLVSPPVLRSPGPGWIADAHPQFGFLPVGDLLLLGMKANVSSRGFVCWRSACPSAPSSFPGRSCVQGSPIQPQPLGQGNRPLPPPEAAAASWGPHPGALLGTASSGTSPGRFLGADGCSADLKTEPGGMGPGVWGCC